MDKRGDKTLNLDELPVAGYISDPLLATHNVQVVVEARGCKFKFNMEVTEIINTGGRTADLGHDTESYQFCIPYLRRHFNVGSFSRRREINTNASFAVIG